MRTLFLSPFEARECASRTSPTGLPAATVIGRYVTIGQGCVLRSTTIGDEVVVGDKCALSAHSIQIETLQDARRRISGRISRIVSRSAAADALRSLFPTVLDRKLSDVWRPTPQYPERMKQTNTTRVLTPCVCHPRCVLMEGSVVEPQAVLAPGSVVPPGALISGGQLWAGVPARYVRDLTKDEVGHRTPAVVKAAQQGRNSSFAGSLSPLGRL